MINAFYTVNYQLRDTKMPDIWMLNSTKKEALTLPPPGRYLIFTIDSAESLTLHLDVNATLLECKERILKEIYEHYDFYFVSSQITALNLKLYHFGTLAEVTQLDPIAETLKLYVVGFDLKG
jgi:hypothetical protein